MRGILPVWVGCLALCGPVFSPPARAAEAAKIDVALIEVQGAPLDAATAMAMTDALGEWLAKGQRFEVVPRRVPIVQTEPKYRVTAVVAKVGAACMWTLQAFKMTDPRIVASATKKGSCEEEALVGLLEQAAEGLATALLRFEREGSQAAPPPPPEGPALVSPLPPAALRAATKEPPVVAVFRAESKGSPLAADEVDSLSDYLSTRLGEAGVFQVLPRSEMLERLGPTAASEFDVCHEPVCRHHLATKAGAGFALSTWVGKVGSYCLMAVDVLDTSSSLLVRSVQVREQCQPDLIIDGFERLAALLGESFRRPRPKAGRGGTPRLAVLTPESRASPLSGDELAILRDYLRGRLLSAVQVECLPTAELRLRAGERPAGASAELSVQTSIAMIGGHCLLSASLWDLASNKQIGAVTVREKCDDDRLVVGLEELSDKLVVLLTRH